MTHSRTLWHPTIASCLVQTLHSWVMLSRNQRQTISEHGSCQKYTSNLITDCSIRVTVWQLTLKSYLWRYWQGNFRKVPVCNCITRYNKNKWEEVTHVIESLFNQVWWDVLSFLHERLGNTKELIRCHMRKHAVDMWLKGCIYKWRWSIL